MTTPTPRWTAETEELVARAVYAAYRWDSSPRTLDALPTKDHGYFREGARAVLDSLARAGVLIPVGGETRQEYGYRAPRGTVMRGWSSSSPPDLVRDVTVWPDEDQPNDNWPRYVGPWREVTDDQEA